MDRNLLGTWLLHRVTEIQKLPRGFGDGATLLRHLDGPRGARRQLEKMKPDDWAAAYLWCFPAKVASVFLARAAI